MRLLTWNINGVRTLPQYHPWNTLKSFDDILDHMGADIICFQEMKSARKLLTQEVAVPPSFDSFFSFPTHKTGYSGVATYTRSKTAVPLKAEEGLSGILQPRPALRPEERVSTYDVYPPMLEENEVDYKLLDSEGRAIVVDMGLFVLINTYCPNDTGTEERERFKMGYHRLLEERVRGLIEQEKREVIVVGDLNACPAVIDHCEGDLIIKKGQALGLEGEEAFWGAEYRRWMRDWLAKGDGTRGCMVDIVRRFWPGRKGMYTCWNTKISARETNYGTRIDFVLVTPGLVPWIRAADTQPHIKGSDHCPVYVDFHDSIVDSFGQTIRLSDVLGARKTGGRSPDPPRLAAKHWEEFSGKQTSLQQFFGKSKSNKGKGFSNESILSPSPSSTISPIEPSENAKQEERTSSPETPISTQPDTRESSPTTVSPSIPTAPSTSFSTETMKRKLVADYTSQPKKLKKTTCGSAASSSSRSRNSQLSIASFFASNTTTKGKGKGKASEVDEVEIQVAEGYNLDDDYKLALQLSQEQEIEFSSSQASQPDSSQSKKVKETWSSLLAPLQPPKCRAHGEPAREFTVNKPGPNKGKKFFICSRPVGPGYDKGRSERLREHVDPQYRCDFFKWSSDVRKEMMKSGASGGAKHTE